MDIDYVLESRGHFRVDTAAYREPSVFQVEMDRLFHQGWIYLGHESEVEHEGDFKTTWIGSQPVLLTRDGEGRIRAFLNFCPHRGATVCREASGNARAFVCPYHGWAFKPDGQLLAIPAPERYPAEFADYDKNLRPIARVDSYRGLVFGSLAENVGSLADFLGAARHHIDLWHDRGAGGRVRVAAAHRYAFNGNWKFQAENTVDGYHPLVVHRSAFEAFRTLDTGFRGTTYVSQKGMGCTRDLPGGHSTLEAGSPLEGSFMSPEERAQYQEMLVQRFGPERAEAIVSNQHLFIFPNLMLMDCNIRVVYPIAADRTEVQSYPVRLEDVPSGVRDGRLRDVQMRLGTAGVVGADDIEIFHGLQAGLRAQAAQYIVLSRGLGMEEILPSGGRVGAMSDETPQRAFWRQWRARTGLFVKSPAEVAP